jgi:hypothetical protein
MEMDQPYIQGENPRSSICLEPMTTRVFPYPSSMVAFGEPSCGICFIEAAVDVAINYRVSQILVFLVLFNNLAVCILDVELLHN